MSVLGAGSTVSAGNYLVTIARSNTQRNHWGGGVSSAHLVSPMKITVVQADAFELDFWLITAVVFGLTDSALARNVPRVAQRQPFTQLFLRNTECR